MLKTPCLMYHQIPAGAPEGKFWTPYANFKEQVDWLAENGYQSIDFATAHPLKTERGVLITFDDGHVSNMKAAEYLISRGFKAVFYVLKNKSLNELDYLTATQIQTIADMGHLVGIHGKDHKWWTSKSEEQLIEEFQETKDWIESLTKTPVITCSAPGGILDSCTVKIIRSRFPTLKYIRSSVCMYNTDMDCERILNSMAIGHGVSMDEFRKIIEVNPWYYWHKYASYVAKNVIKRLIRVMKV